jgi:dTDP-4-amino-4,6-dideoxy-D-galactose acyltransferase
MAPIETAMNEPCSLLEWDTAFFGRRIGRVNGGRLDEAQADAALAWCAAQNIDCVYFLADSDDAGTVRAVEARGFILVDARITLERTGTAPAMPGHVRLSQAGDVAALKAMAASHHRKSRFYYDAHFSQAECEAMYATWIERSCDGSYADAVLVAERDGQPAGYATCEIQAGGGEIGLLGVGEAWQRQGIGTALVNGALAWFDERGIATVEVVTQARNISAQRLYQRCGFVTKRVQFSYHRWFEAD